MSREQRPSCTATGAGLTPQALRVEHADVLRDLGVEHLLNHHAVGLGVGELAEGRAGFGREAEIVFRILDDDHQLFGELRVELAEVLQALQRLEAIAVRHLGRHAGLLEVDALILAAREHADERRVCRLVLEVAERLGRGAHVVARELLEEQRTASLAPVAPSARMIAPSDACTSRPRSWRAAPAQLPGSRGG